MVVYNLDFSILDFAFRSVVPLSPLSGRSFSGSVFRGAGISEAFARLAEPNSRARTHAIFVSPEQRGLTLQPRLVPLRLTLILLRSLSGLFDSSSSLELLLAWQETARAEGRMLFMPLLC